MLFSLLPFVRLCCYPCVTASRTSALIGNLPCPSLSITTKHPDLLQLRQPLEPMTAQKKATTVSPLSPPPSPPHDESERHSPVFPQHGYALTASKSLNSLRHALRAAKSNGGDRSGSTSEEDYDKITQSPDTLVLRRRKPAAGEGGKLRDSVPAGAVLNGRTDGRELREVFKNGLQSVGNTEFRLTPHLRNSSSLRSQSRGRNRG